MHKGHTQPFNCYRFLSFLTTRTHRSNTPPSLSLLSTTGMHPINSLPFCLVARKSLFAELKTGVIRLEGDAASQQSVSALQEIELWQGERHVGKLGLTGIHGPWLRVDGWVSAQAKAASQGTGRSRTNEQKGHFCFACLFACGGGRVTCVCVSVCVWVCARKKHSSVILFAVWHTM